MNSWGSSAVEHSNCNREGGGSNPSPSTILAGHQPVYLPGIIFFNKLALSDMFMFVGHCDYQPRSWHSHNYIRAYHGKQKLSVPVHRHGASINETVPLGGNTWRDHHLRCIHVAYRKAYHFKDYFPEIEACISMPAKSLSDLNIGLIRVLMRMLEIDTPTYCSEDWNIQGHKTEMLVNMCSRLGARHYLSSPGERAYVDKSLMNGYGHSFQQFTHPVYSQGAHRTFMPDLSVIDLLFHQGPRAARFVRESGHV